MWSEGGKQRYINLVTSDMSLFPRFGLKIHDLWLSLMWDNMCLNSLSDWTRQDLFLYFVFFLYRVIYEAEK